MTKRVTSWTPAAPRRARRVDAHVRSRRRAAWLLLVFALFGVTGLVTLISSRPLR